MSTKAKKELQFTQGDNLVLHTAAGNRNDSFSADFKTASTIGPSIQKALQHLFTLSSRMPHTLKMHSKNHTFASVMKQVAMKPLTVHRTRTANKETKKPARETSQSIVAPSLPTASSEIDSKRLFARKHNL